MFQWPPLPRVFLHFAKLLHAEHSHGWSQDHFCAVSSRRAEERRRKRREEDLHDAEDREREEKEIETKRRKQAEDESAGEQMCMNLQVFLFLHFAQLNCTVPHWRNRCSGCWCGFVTVETSPCLCNMHRMDDETKREWNGREPVALIVQNWKEAQHSVGLSKLPVYQGLTVLYLHCVCVLFWFLWIAQCLCCRWGFCGRKVQCKESVMLAKRSLWSMWCLLEMSKRLSC